MISLLLVRAIHGTSGSLHGFEGVDKRLYKYNLVTLLYYQRHKHRGAGLFLLHLVGGKVGKA